MGVNIFIVKSFIIFVLINKNVYLYIFHNKETK